MFHDQHSTALDEKLHKGPCQVEKKRKIVGYGNKTFSDRCKNSSCLNFALDPDLVFASLSAIMWEENGRSRCEQREKGGTKWRLLIGFGVRVNRHSLFHFSFPSASRLTRPE